jgi:hypothetical protein
MTVRKATSTPVATQFAFELEGPGVLEEFLLTGGELVTFEELPAGSYVVSETVPEDWELSAISCGVFFAPGPVASGSLEVELGAGEDMLCEFFNTSLTIPPTVPPEEPVHVPTLSPTALSVLFMALAAAGGALIGRLRLE